MAGDHRVLRAICPAYAVLRERQKVPVVGAVAGPAVVIREQRVGPALTHVGRVQDAGMHVLVHAGGRWVPGPEPYPAEIDVVLQAADVVFVLPQNRGHPVDPVLAIRIQIEISALPCAVIPAPVQAVLQPDRAADVQAVDPRLVGGQHGVSIVLLSGMNDALDAFAGGYVTVIDEQRPVPRLPSPADPHFAVGHVTLQLPSANDAIWASIVSWRPRSCHLGGFTGGPPGCTFRHVYAGT